MIQYLFIDLFLILPIAIFSESKSPKKLFLLLIFLLCSGLDWCIPYTFSQETNREFGVSKSFYSSTRPGIDMYAHTINFKYICSATGLVLAFLLNLEMQFLTSA